MALDRRPRGQEPVRESDDAFEDHVVKIYRCACVVKGGRRFSFAALVVVGDRNGKIGIGYGKAKEVPMSVDKAIKEARKNLVEVSLKGNTIPHKIVGRFGASSIVLVPAQAGTGVIAGKNVRPMLELAGVKDVLTKAYGSTTPKNLVKATLDALVRLRTPEEVAEIRGVEVEQ
ncbi:MAG: 30S ribosomal protein S5 [Planctomycetes bacterium]|nr:30S ribosomal protein S5 [Planctomycetota bacterium]